MDLVRNHRNKTVVDAARLHRAKDRRKTGLTLLEGPHLISDVRKAGGVIEQTFTTNPEEDGVAVDERALKRLAGTDSPRGPIAVVRIPKERLIDDQNLLVAVGISDPGNLGTLVRTAASFGWGFAYTSGTADPWSPKAMRAGAGGQFQTAVARIESLSELDLWTTVATVVTGGIDPEEVSGFPLALLVGEEAHGLDDDDAERATLAMTIPTAGTTESLNAAVAAGIAVYALSKHSLDEGGQV